MQVFKCMVLGVYDSITHVTVKLLATIAAA